MTKRLAESAAIGVVVGLLTWKAAPYGLIMWWLIVLAGGTVGAIIVARMAPRLQTLIGLIPVTTALLGMWISEYRDAVLYQKLDLREYLSQMFAHGLVGYSALLVVPPLIVSFLIHALTRPQPADVSGDTRA